MSEAEVPRVFGNRWADAVGPAGGVPDRDRCECFEQYRDRPQPSVHFHPDRQDTTAPGRQHLLALIEEAAADRREVFKPLVELSAEERRQLITLPPTIAKLKSVRHMVLYGSNLVRIPPEIGGMESLEEFSPYTSHQLHWFPYELTRCQNLQRSTVSTRSVYGNYKLPPQFPALQPSPTPTADLNPNDLDPGQWGGTTLGNCSVCNNPLQLSELRQVWISRRVATDVLPLLVNACSPTCVDSLPHPPEHYVPTPHRGGPTITQPPTGYPRS
nr:leucine-rich repeat domain-containing protein [Streptomyces sp. 846.5]